MSLIHAVFLDLGNTLVDIKPELYEDSARRIATARRQALNNSRELKQVVFELKQAEGEEWIFTELEKFQQVTSVEDEVRYLRKEFYPAVLQRLGISSAQPALVDLLARRLADPESFTCFPDVLEVLQDLTGMGVELGIISNALPSARKILEHLDLIHLFKHVVLSNEISCAKPAWGIYLHAARCANIRPDQAIFVDDRPLFVLEAQKVGMYAFLIDRERRHREGGEDAKIYGLREIVDLVQSTLSLPIAPASSFWTDAPKMEAKDVSCYRYEGLAVP
jgi:HAD superfamily hydrolase (TIGR01509 family)